MATRKTKGNAVIWIYTYTFDGQMSAHAFTTHQACRESWERSQRLAADMGYSNISEPAPVALLAS